MADPELEEIRARRMAQLQSQMKVGGGGGGGGQDQEAAEERKAQAEEMKNAILSRVLNQSARARLNTLMLGKPERGKMVENMILQMAQTGQIGQQLEESDLIRILEQISNNDRFSKATTVKFDRRRAALDDSDDDFS
nr:PREDICTED: programmed cell death protein 5 [Bemisia tabaci]